VIDVIEPDARNPGDERSEKEQPEPDSLTARPLAFPRIAQKQPEIDQEENGREHEGQKGRDHNGIMIKTVHSGGSKPAGAQAMNAKTATVM
jgi:hypothetical protein